MAAPFDMMVQVAAAHDPSLLEGDIRGHLVRLALPTAVGVVLIIAINVIDTYFVGQLGNDELAAMSFTFPVASLVMSVAMGLGIGSTSAISRAIGAGDENERRRLATHAIFLAVLVVAVISSVGIVTQRGFFRLLGATEALLPLLESYMTIWYAGAAFLVVPMVGTGALRAGGDARTPMVVMAIAALANLALDPLFIFGAGPIPGLGIQGAAIATLIARFLTLVTTLVILQRREIIDWHIPTAAELFDSWRRICSVGIPAAISNALAPVAMGVMTALFAAEGTAAVAAYGVASRVEGLLLIPAMALGAAMTPFVGQNWGAHREQRVGEGLRRARRFVLAWGLFVWAVVAALGRPLGAIFSDDPETIAAVAAYMWIVPASYGAAGLVSVVSAVFNAIDRAIRATLLSAARTLLLAVPLALLGSRLGGLWGIYVGIATATLVTAVLAARWSRSLLAPARDLARVERCQEVLTGIPAELEAAVDSLLDRVDDIESVTAAPRPINTIGFYVDGFEVGHVHRTGKIDLHVPPAIHDALLDEGRAEHHRHRHELSWITHRLEGADDVAEAEWLLRLTAGLLRRGRGVAGEGQGEDPLVALDLSPRLRAAVDETLRVCASSTPA